MRIPLPGWCKCLPDEIKERDAFQTHLVDGVSHLSTRQDDLVKNMFSDGSYFGIGLHSQTG